TPAARLHSTLTGTPAPGGPAREHPPVEGRPHPAPSPEFACARRASHDPRSVFSCARCTEAGVNTLTNGQIFLYETLGTATLLLLGCGVVANAILRDSKGFGGGWLLINFGWGLGVYMGVYVAFPTGAHLNPAVTISQLMVGNITGGQAVFYFLGEFLGAFLGAV